MTIQPENTIRGIRSKRSMTIAYFAHMLKISAAYLSFIEAGKRKLQPQIIDKIIASLPDLTPSEKQELYKIKEMLGFSEFEQVQKEVMKLISDYLYRIKNEILDGIKELGEKIINLIKGLNEKYLTAEMGGLLLAVQA